MLGTAKDIPKLSNCSVQITTRLFSRTGKETSSQNQQTHGLDTITQILMGRLSVKNVINSDFCMESQL